MTFVLRDQPAMKIVLLALLVGAASAFEAGNMKAKHGICLDASQRDRAGGKVRSAQSVAQSVASRPCDLAQTILSPFAVPLRPPFA